MFVLPLFVMRGVSLEWDDSWYQSTAGNYEGFSYSFYKQWSLEVSAGSGGGVMPDVPASQGWRNMPVQFPIEGYVQGWQVTCRYEDGSTMYVEAEQSSVFDYGQICPKYNKAGSAWSPDGNEAVLGPITVITGHEEKNLTLYTRELKLVGVSKISASAFRGMSELKTVLFQECAITEIGRSAFSGCTSLGNLEFPVGLQSIGAYAFLDCPIVSIELPQTIEVFGTDSLHIQARLPRFTGGAALRDMRGLSASSIGVCDLSKCSNLEFLMVPCGIEELIFPATCAATMQVECASGSRVTKLDLGGMTSIPRDLICDREVSDLTGGKYDTVPDNAFYNFQGTVLRVALQSVTFPDNLQSIGRHAFYGCTKLQSVTFPDNLQSIDMYAFYGCTKLQSVTFGDGLQSIGSDAFFGCGSLESVTFGDSLQSIGSNAFTECGSLESVTFGDSLQSIGSYAFYGCTKLQSVTLPDSLQSIGRYAFCGCTKLQSVTLPDSLQSVGERAFSACTNLTEVVCGANLEELGSEVFSGCPLPVLNLSRCRKLRSIDIHSNITLVAGPGLCEVSIGDSRPYPTLDLSRSESKVFNISRASSQVWKNLIWSPNFQTLYVSNSVGFEIPATITTLVLYDIHLEKDFTLPSTLKNVTICHDVHPGSAYDPDATNITITIECDGSAIHSGQDWVKIYLRNIELGGKLIQDKLVYKGNGCMDVPVDEPNNQWVWDTDWGDLITLPDGYWHECDSFGGHEKSDFGKSPAGLVAGIVVPVVVVVGGVAGWFVWRKRRAAGEKEGEENSVASAVEA